MCVGFYKMQYFIYILYIYMEESLDFCWQFEKIHKIAIIFFKYEDFVLQIFALRTLSGNDYM